MTKIDSATPTGLGGVSVSEVLAKPTVGGLDSAPVIDGEQTVTSSELDRWASSIASHLCRLGVNSEVVVVLLLPHSAEFIGSALGVLRAGRAYPPLDLAHPRESLAFMLSDSGCTVVTSDDLHTRQLPEGNWRQLILEATPPGATAASNLAAVTRGGRLLVERHPETDHHPGQAEIPRDPETRRWLARELHDTVGATLSGMLMDMEYLKRQGGGSGLHDEIERLQHSAREVLDSLRRLLNGLRNEPTHITDFADRVYEVLERFERLSGIPTMLVADDNWPCRMVGRTAHHLLRIVEEALQNIRRHSCARSVEITLERVGDDAVLTVKDDGRGLQGPADGQGFGITGMNEYAVLAGGVLRIESSPDRGTAVRVSLPLEKSR